MSLTSLMNKPISNLWVGQTISAYSKNNNLIEGRILLHNGKKIVLMENKKWIPLEGLTHIKCVGRNLREAIAQTVSDFLPQNKYKYSDLVKDTKYDKYVDAFADQIEAVDKDAKNNHDETRQTIDAQLKKNALEKDVDAGTLDKTKAAEELTNTMINDEDESGNKDQNQKLDEYIAKKRASIRERIRRIKEDFVDDIEDDLDLEDYDEGDFETEDDLEDDSEDYSDDDLYDDEDIVSDEEAKEFVDDSEGHGLSDDNYTKAYEDAVALFGEKHGFYEVSEQLMADYECSPDEAEDIAEDAMYDNIDEATDNEIEEAVDEFEDKAEIYDDEELLEHICSKYNITNGAEVLQECGNVPDAVLKIAETIKQKMRIEKLLERATRSINRILESADADDIKYGRIIALFENERFMDAVYCRKDINTFRNRLQENFKDNAMIGDILVETFESNL